MAPSMCSNNADPVHAACSGVVKNVTLVSRSLEYDMCVTKARGYSRGTLTSAVRKMGRRGVIMAHSNGRGHHHRREVLLLILQAWIVPCRGFSFVPHGCNRPFLASSTLHAPAAASTWGTRAGGAGSRSARLAMSDRGSRWDEVSVIFMQLVWRIQ